MKIEIDELRVKGGLDVTNLRNEVDEFFLKRSCERGLGVAVNGRVSHRTCHRLQEKMLRLDSIDDAN